MAGSTLCHRKETPANHAATTLTYFNVSRNIEINNNTLTNTNGQFPSFIAVGLQLNTLTTFWGKSVMGLVVRNNQITAQGGDSVLPVR